MFFDGVDGAFEDIDRVRDYLRREGTSLSYDVLSIAEETLKKEFNKREWIPVTERLPERDGMYFVTKENEYGRYIATEWFYQDKTWSTGWKVVAWMPMPKPYMEGAEK